MRAMLGMSKLNIAELEHAADGGDSAFRNGQC
jgi:hypothetical protein